VPDDVIILSQHAPVFTVFSDDNSMQILCSAMSASQLMATVLSPASRYHATSRSEFFTCLPLSLFFFFFFFIEKMRMIIGRILFLSFFSSLFLPPFFLFFSLPDQHFEGLNMRLPRLGGTVTLFNFDIESYQR